MKNSRVASLATLVLLVLGFAQADTARPPIPEYGKKSASSVSINVFGAVKKPGIYCVRADTTLRQLMGWAEVTSRFDGRCGVRRFSGDQWTTT